MLTITLTTTTDYAPMLMDFARRARLVAGETPPSDAELEAVREHVGQTLEANTKGEEKALRSQLTKALPKGITLKKLESSRDGLTVTSNTTLELDDVRLVPEVVLSAVEGQPPLKPFSDFTVKQDRAGLVLSGRAPEVPEGAGSVQLSLRPSTKPISHNAQKQDGSTLTWQGSGFEVKVVFPA